MSARAWLESSDGIVLPLAAQLAASTVPHGPSQHIHFCPHAPPCHPSSLSRHTFFADGLLRCVYLYVFAVRTLLLHSKQCSYFLMGLLQLGTLPCSAFGSASHAHSLNLVGISLRLLAVVSGELEANMRHRILVGRCHRLIDGKFAARDGEPSATGVAISAACNVSTLMSTFQSQVTQGSCPCLCTRARGAGIAPRRYFRTDFARSFDLDLFHVLHGFSPFPCPLRPLQADGPLRSQLFPLRLVEKAGVFVRSLSPKIFTSCADSWATSWRRSFTFTTWVRARSYNV